MVNRQPDDENKAAWSKGFIKKVSADEFIKSLNREPGYAPKDLDISNFKNLYIQTSWDNSQKLPPGTEVKILKTLSPAAGNALISEFEIKGTKGYIIGSSFYSSNPHINWKQIPLSDRKLLKRDTYAKGMSDKAFQALYFFTSFEKNYYQADTYVQWIHNRFGYFYFKNGKLVDWQKIGKLRQ